MQPFLHLFGMMRAVWAHMEPVLTNMMENCNPSPTTLHVMSDGPVIQYRNKKIYFSLAPSPAGDLELLWEIPWKRCPWWSWWCSQVSRLFFWVSEKDIRRFYELVPVFVPPVHISTEPGKIMHRNHMHILCSCTMVNLQMASTQACANDNYLNGKFILVKY